MDVERVLAFRLARSGLARRDAGSLAEAAACPASDFSRDAAVHALAARFDGVTREGYDAAVDSGEVVVAHVVRGAIHALDPGDFALYGRALVAGGDEDLGPQLGRQMRRLADEHGFDLADALDEVSAATTDALSGGRRLGKNALHEQLRARVRSELMPWCEGCQSHHVAPMLWRYATVRAGVRLDSERRYLAGKPGRRPRADGAVQRFLGWYAPATPAEFADWAGVGPAHGRRLWDEVAGELIEAGEGRFALAADADELASPPGAEGIRLLPPGDPYLWKINRPLLAPDKELRSRLFRPVASPGAVLRDGRLVGLWRAKAKGKKLEVTVEKLTRLARGPVEEEAARVAALRDADLSLAM